MGIRTRIREWLAAPNEGRTPELDVVGRSKLSNGLRRAAWKLRRRTLRAGRRRLVEPVDVHFGFSRGRPVDRIYIDAALAAHSDVIKGRVIEVGDSFTTDSFGGPAVTDVDVLHIDPDAPGATVIADLADAREIADASYDCVICPQTLHLIYDFEAAISEMHRMLAPGGAALVTFPGITPLGDVAWIDTWMWAFTSRSAKRMFEPVFGAENVTIEAFGNVTTATAFVAGLSAEDLRPTDFAPYDPRYEIVIVVKATKPVAEGSRE